MVPTEKVPCSTATSSLAWRRLLMRARRAHLRFLGDSQSPTRPGCSGIREARQGERRVKRRGVQLAGKGARGSRSPMPIFGTPFEPTFTPCSKCSPFLQPHASAMLRSP